LVALSAFSSSPPQFYQRCLWIHNRVRASAGKHIARSLRRKQESKDALAVLHLARRDEPRGLGHRHAFQRNHLVRIAVKRVVDEVRRQENVNELGAVPWRDEEPAKTLQPSRMISRLLTQLALGRILGALAVVCPAGGY